MLQRDNLISDYKTTQRRCVSVPSSMRLNIGRDKVQDEEIAQFVSGYFSDLLADSGATPDEETVASAATDLSKSQYPWTLKCATKVVMPKVQQVVPLIPHGYPIEPIMAFYTQPREKGDLHDQAEAYEPEELKMNTKAKVTPGCYVQQSPPSGRLHHKWRKRLVQFRWESQELIMSVKQAMECCTFVHGVEVLMEKNTLTIDAYSRPEYFECMGQALSKAKQALLDSAEKSQNVYVMGYCSSPFMRTPSGFFARLGFMSCAREACWETFYYGCCGNIDTCKRQHPFLQMHVYINVKFEAEF